MKTSKKKKNLLFFWGGALIALTLFVSFSELAVANDESETGNKQLLSEDNGGTRYSDTYEVEIISNKEELDFGEEAEITFMSKDAIKYNYEVWLYKDGNSVAFYPDISYFNISFVNDEKSVGKLGLLLSPGDYLIRLVDINSSSYPVVGETGLKVKASESSFILDNYKFDKEEVTPEDNLGVTFETKPPYISNDIEEGLVVTSVHGGGYGFILQYEKGADGRLSGINRVSEETKNGKYAVRAFYGRYKDDEGIEHVTYLENLFDNNINYTVYDSPEDAKGGGPKHLLHPGLLTSWEDNNSSKRLAEEIKETDDEKKVNDTVVGKGQGDDPKHDVIRHEIQESAVSNISGGKQMIFSQHGYQTKNITSERKADNQEIQEEVKDKYYETNQITSALNPVHKESRITQLSEVPVTGDINDFLSYSLVAATGFCITAGMLYCRKKTKQ